MRTLIAILLLLPLGANAQALWRNFFTTNQAPRVTVVAGSNATVVASTVGADQRIFTVSSTATGGGQTNVAVVLPGTNTFVITNAAGGVYQYTVHSTGQGYVPTNGWDGAGLIYSNGVPVWSNDGWGFTNVPFSIWTNYTGFPANYTNVNGLGFGTGMYGMTNYWDYATVPGVGPIIVWYNGIDTNTVITTNGGAFSGQILDNSASASAPVSNQLVTAYWVRNLFNVGAAYYISTNIDNAATNSDAPGQVVYKFESAIPISDLRAYTTLNYLTNTAYIGAVVTTNTFSSLGGQIVVNSFMSFTGGASTPTLTVHPEIYYSYDKTNWYGDYSAGNQNIVHGITNLYQWVIDFPAYTATNAMGFYVQRRFKVGAVTGTGTRTLQIFVGTNALSGVSDASHITMQSPSATAGNAYLQNNQTFTGSNYFSGGFGAVGPIQLYGDQYRTNGLYYSSAGVLTSNANGSVNISGGSIASTGTLTVTNASGTTNQLGPVYIGPNPTNASIIVGTNQLQFRNTRGNGTNIFYIDDATGAILFNADGTYNIGGSSTTFRPKNIWASANISAGGLLGAGQSILIGSSYSLSWTRAAISSPAANSHSLRIYDSSTSADRFYINGPVKALTSTTAISLFTVVGRTNDFVGGTVDYTIFCTDNTEAQTLSGIVTYACINTNGVWYSKVATENASNQAKAVTSGTLTTSWGLIDDPTSGKGTTNVNMQVTATTSLTPAANKFYILWQLRNNGTNSITAL